MSTDPDTQSEPHDCPTCGESWRDQQTMRIHHAQKHGQRIVDHATCTYCGERFEPESGSEGKYCSLACVGADRANRTEKTCVRCGDTFSVSPCDHDQQYCSKDCYLDGIRGRNRLTCPACGVSFERYASQGSNQYCSNACYAEANTSRPRPERLEMQAWLLYEYEDNTLWDTYKRINVIRDDSTPKDEVRDVLADLGVLGKRPADRLHNRVKNGQIDVDWDGETA